MSGAWSAFAAVMVSSSVAVAAAPEKKSFVGKDAPEVGAAGWLHAGKDKVSLKDFEGKVVVVEFWATWCPPCRTIIPHLVETHGKLKDKGLVIISLTDEPLNKIEKFVADQKMAYIIGYGSKTIRDYGVRGIPAAFVVVDGKVVWQGHPADKKFDKVIEEELGKLKK